MKKLAILFAITSAAIAHADPVATFQGHGAIGDGGAVIDSSVALEKRGSTLHIHAHGEVHNYLLAQDVSPSVIVSLIAKDGTTYSQIRVDIAHTPGRGFPWNGAVARDANADVDLAIDAHVAQGLGEVRWQFFDRAPGSPLPALAQTAIDVVVPALLGG
jgi:hypothetical protein